MSARSGGGARAKIEIWGEDQRAKLMFHIEQVKSHLAELESGAVRITAGG